MVLQFGQGSQDRFVWFCRGNLGPDRLVQRFEKLVRVGGFWTVGSRVED